MWIFGYGSLIWKVDFPYESKIVGYIKGFERKFYQHSTDHRGTPERPGRVVTLVPNNEELCVWGVAYKIKETDVEKVMDHLDYREKGGYQRTKVLFFPFSIYEKPFDITIYVGTKDNKNYAGEADDNSIAEQILNSVGPSGTNIEYLLNLAKAMREIAPHVNDQHLFSIEAKVLNTLKERSCHE
ncbi:hypothetical protein RN001_016196 [Aquatica leii]|uniref:glutathione-specific gamma-glutamylcyclotransferase n=1 Tax=Aquatica leii TaxID=1421715 RepID=A0AAN7SBA3_9COLE|nr:hypothetical protein RN001_016196 [Aquatica leii]